MDAFIEKLERRLKENKKLFLGSDIGKLFSNEEELGIKRIYLMYEFSDKVRLLEDSPQYGSLHNYVESGLLTQEEAWRAALM